MADQLWHHIKRRITWFVEILESSTSNGHFALGLGRENEAVADYGLATGYGARAALFGSQAHAAGIFGTTGDAQHLRLVARVQTTDATPVELRLDGDGQRLALPDNSSWSFHAIVHAHRSDSSGAGGWLITGVIERRIGAATTTLIGSSVTALGNNTGASAPAIAADTSNGALALTVTGAAGQTIRWVGDLRMVQSGS